MLKEHVIVGIGVVTLASGCAHAPSGSEPETAVQARAHVAMQRYEMYGMSGSIVVVDSGLRVLDKGFGLADRERRVRATSSTVYDVGSITKTFTAAAILRLVADGRLDLRAPIASYLGDVPSDKSSISVHDILTHTAGFPLDPSEAAINPEDSNATFVAKALRAPLAHQPRTVYEYSNLGYGLLAIIVERQSGEDFRSFVTRRLIEPAGLKHTRWWSDTAAITGSDTRGYLFSDREYVLDPEPPLSRGARNSPMWSKWPLGAAGIITTPGDLVLWLEALRGNKLFPDSLTSKLFELQAMPGSQTYGWTVSSSTTAGERIHRGGARSGFTSLLAYYPDSRSVIAFALNQQADAGWQTVVWRSLERAIAGKPDTLPPPTVPVSRTDLERFAGLYRAGPRSHVRVIAEEGALIVGGEGQPAADVLVERRGEDSAITVNASQRSRSIISDALTGSIGESTRTMVGDPLELQHWIRARAKTATVDSFTILATVPHPAGPGVVHTFVRLGNAQNAPVVRLIWERDKVGAYADGIRLPGFGRFRMISKDVAVAYHPSDPERRTIEFHRDGAGRAVGITVIGATGERSPRLHRID